MHLTGLLSSVVDLNYDNMTSCCNTSCEVGRSEGISLIFTLKSFGESIGNSLVPKTDRLQSKTHCIESLEQGDKVEKAGPQAIHGSCSKEF